MSGRGDVVLASLKLGEARLRLPADPSAQYVLHGPRAMMAEVHGEAGAVSLALPAGDWRVERRTPEGRSTARVLLERGDTRELPVLVPTSYEMARAKGGPLPAELFLGGGAAALPLSGLGVAPLLRAGYRQELDWFALRLEADYLRRDAIADQSLRYGVSALGGSLALLAPVVVGPVLLELGPQAGYSYAWQSLTDGRGFSGGLVQLGAAAVASARAGPLRLGLDASVGGYLFRLDGSQVARPGGSLALLVLWGLQ
jgi:hypothetical protein